MAANHGFTEFSLDCVAIYHYFILPKPALKAIDEAQLTKIASLFILDDRAAGGLGLSTKMMGFIYGTVGAVALVVGGILGGYSSLPAWQQPESTVIISGLVAVEQFGYGFGFTAFMMYLIYIAQGQFKTAHYAIATGFMAAGMMLPGMVSGFIQESLGYTKFFIWVLVATLPAFYIISRLPLERGVGKAD